MYCMKCGKINVNGEYVCDECKAKQAFDPYANQPQNDEKQDQQEEATVSVAEAETKFTEEEIHEQENRGKKQAIGGVVSGAIAYGLYQILSVLMEVVVDLCVDKGSAIGSTLPVAIVSMIGVLVMIAPTALAFVWGLKSIFIWIDAKRKKETLPTFTFVCGIVALCFAFLALIDIATLTDDIVVLFDILYGLMPNATPVV